MTDGFTTVAPKYMTLEGLISAFYGAYEGDGDPKPYAREIQRRVTEEGDEQLLWNYPGALEDSYDELS